MALFTVRATPTSNIIPNEDTKKTIDLTLVTTLLILNDVDYKIKDPNGDSTLREAWERKCKTLNRIQSELYYVVS